jgi:type IV secretory pathway VirB10-like protein
VAGTPQLRPLPPLAKRLNRNALTVAAVLMGMTVLTAIVVVRPSHDTPERPSTPAAVEEASPAPSRPAFLDEPVRASPTRTDTAPGVPVGMPGTDPAHGGLGVVPDTAAPIPSSVGPSPRLRSYRAALQSAAVLRSADTPPAPNAHGESDPLAAEEQQLVRLGDSVLRAAPRAGVGGIGAMSPTPRERAHRAFLDAVGDARGGTMSPRLEPAGSPYTLRAGTVIPGLLVTGINSDLPGDLVGQVSRDVYDSRTQRLCLIPKGARLIGTYDNQIAAGEDRLLVAWTRLILPDGRSLRLPGLALKDLAGQTGAQGRVDTHWQRVFGKAVLLSAIGAGAQLSQPQQASVLATPSAGQVAAGALGQELSSAALEILRRGLDVPPTITVAAGQPFNVFLNGDLVFDGPYEDERPDAKLTSSHYR